MFVCLTYVLACKDRVASLQSVMLKKAHNVRYWQV
jgi:hypothetical protein